MMRFAYLGSGSKGNAALISTGNTTILLDCGLGLREAEQRLQRLGLGAADLAAIVVTHEHAAMADLAGVDLVDLALVEEGHTVKALGTAHTSGQGRGARILTDLPLLGAVWREKTADWRVLAAEDEIPGRLRAVPEGNHRQPASPCAPSFGDGVHDAVDER